MYSNAGKRYSLKSLFYELHRPDAHEPAAHISRPKGLRRDFGAKLLSRLVKQRLLLLEVRQEGVLGVRLLQAPAFRVSYRTATSTAER